MAHPDPTPREPEPIADDQTHEAPPDGVTLLDNEYVLESRNPSIVNWWKSLTLATLLLVSGVSNGLTELTVAAVLIGLYVFLAHRQSRYVVTNQRVLKKLKLIRRSTGETRIRLERQE